MKQDTQLQLRVGKEFKDAVQRVADTNYMTLTNTVIRALKQTYPELVDQPLKSFDQTIGVPAAKKAMDEMKPEDPAVKAFGHKPAKFGAEKFEKGK